MIRYLQSSGWQFEIACPGNTELVTAATAVNIVHRHWSVFDSESKRKSQEAIREDIAQLIAAHRPTVVHCNSLSTGRLVGPVTAAMRIPAVGYLRDIIKLSRQAITDLNQLDRQIAVSQATRSFHLSQGLDADRSMVIYNGVDLKKFSPRSSTGYLHEQLKLCDRARLILSIGQIGLRKATDIAINAFETSAGRYLTCICC